jgi:internalin A
MFRLSTFRLPMKNPQPTPRTPEIMSAGRRLFTLAALAATLLGGSIRLQAQYVQFPDANLAAVVGNALGVPADQITPAEMQTLTYFYANWGNIGDTTGLETAWNLSTLDLGGNNLTNLSGLAGLTNLEGLNLWGCGLTNISALSTLTNLNWLLLGYNKITNVAPLSGLFQLQTLGLYVNSITNWSPLGGLTNISDLQIEQNPAPNLSPLASLWQLVGVNASGCGVKDVAPLTTLTNLTSLTFDNNPATNIGAISNLVGLGWLEAENCGLSDASCLGGLSNLRRLSLEGNGGTVLSNMPSLDHFPSLTYLNLAYTEPTDTGFLDASSPLVYLDLTGNFLTSLPQMSGLAYIETLALNNNYFTNPPQVAKLTNLTEVDLDNNPLTTLDGLSGATNLQTLDISYNSVYDQSPGSGLTNCLALSQLPALVYLYASFSGLSDLTPLANLTNLNTLSLEQDNVGDVEPLAALSQLQSLDLWYNILTSIHPLTNLTALEWLDVSYNYLDFSAGSQALTDLNTLEERADVNWSPQNYLPSFGIAQQPQNLAVAANTSPTFNVTVTNSAPVSLSYQWQFDGNDLAGNSASDTLTLGPGLDVSQSGSYRVRVTDNFSGIFLYSRSAQLTVTNASSTPDLTVNSAVSVSPNPVYAGTTLTVSYSVTNQGGASCPASHTRIQIMPGSSSTSVVDSFHTTPIIAAGASLSEQVSISIPASLAAGSYTIYVELDYDQAAGQTTGNDTAQTSVGALAILPPPTLAQAVGATNLVFTTGGDAPWFVEATNTYNGAPAALQSGHLAYNQGSWLSATIIGPGTLSFWWNVDPDTYDVLSCHGIASDTQWEYFLFQDSPRQWVHEALELPAGPCTFYWSYGKNSSSSTHTDAGWLDNVSYISHLPVIAISPQQWEFPGQTFTVTSSVTGGTPLSGFQWYLNGNPIPGGTTNGYGPLTASYANAGTYTLLVSNPYATVSNSTKVVVAPLFYQVTDLGALWPGEYSTYTCGLNNFNDVVGYCVTNNTNVGRAWVWSAGVMTDLGDPLGGGDSKAYGINDQGDIVGTARVPGTTNYDAILWHKTGGGYTVNDLGRAGWPFAFAQAINNAGDIAFSTTDGGFYEAGNRRAYLWRQGVLTPLGGAIPLWTNAPSDAYGFSINSLGLIAGDSRYTLPGTSDFSSIAWIYNGSCRENLQADYPLTNLPADLMVDSSSASYINDYGDVLGSCLRSDYGGVMAAYLISGTNLSFLAEGWNSIPVGFNDHGDVIRSIEFEAYPYFGFALFCSTNAGMPAHFADGRPDYSDHASFDLDDLLPGGMVGFVGLNQVIGCGINEAGSIAGDGPTANEQQHAFLATRLPLAGNHAPVSTGVLSLTNASSTLVFPISSVLAKATDADGDPLFLLTTTQPVSGAATLRRNAGNLIYQANGSTLPANDSFSCIITDYHGGLATNQVQVLNLASGQCPQPNQIILLGNPSLSSMIRFHASSGQTWRIQASDDLGTGAWTTIATVIAGPDGIIDANDALGVGHARRFYRAVMP